MPLIPSKRRLFAALAAFVLAAAAPLALAQDSSRPVQYLSASVQSLDRLSRAANDLDIKLPPFLTAEGIQASFSNSGRNVTLDGQRPIGVLFFMAPGFNVSAGQGIVFELPVTEGSATVESFVQAGGQKDPDHPDTALMNGAAFRRTSHYFMFSQRAGDVALGNDADLPRLYPPAPRQQAAGRQVDARVNFDLKAFLRGAGVSLDQLMKDQNDANPHPGVDPVWNKLGQDVAVNWIKSIDRLNTAVSRVGQQFELQLAMSPSSVSSSGKFSRPGMPTGVLARLDMAYSPLKAMPWIDQLADGAANAMASDKTRTSTPAQQQALKSFVHSTAELLLGAQAESVALTPQGKSVVVYIVQRFAKPVDIEARARAVANSFNRVGGANDPSKIQVKKYSDRGQTAVRLTEDENGNPTTYLDAVQKGNTVFLAASDDPGHHVLNLLDLPDGGAISDLAVGSVDLEAIARLATSQGAFASATPEQRKLIEDLVNGQSLDFTMTREGEGIAFNIAMKADLLKKVIRTVQQLIGGQQQATEKP